MASIPPPPMQTVGSLTAVAESGSADELVLLLGPAVLIGGAPDEAQDDDDEPWAFNTVSSSSLEAVKGDPVDAFRESLIFPIRKARSGAFADTVLIGRSSSNDVCIPDASLSKLHARVHLNADGTMHVSDSGSKNGTRVNGRSVGAKLPVAIHHGDDLQLGTRTFKVYDTKRLHGMLRSLG